MRGIKIPLQDFALKMQRAYARGGAYLRDTTVYCYIHTVPKYSEHQSGSNLTILQASESERQKQN